MKFRRNIIVFLVTLCFGVAFSQNVVKPMPAQRLVNDFANIIDTRAKAILEDSLVAFSEATSTQIVVATVNDLNGYAVSDYAIELGRQWGVGQNNKNNGIVILVKPRNENGKGEVYIAVGYGLEGVLNDAKAGRLIDKFMLPELRKGDYSEAIVNGTFAVMATVRGEYKADQTTEDDIVSIISIIIGFIIVMIFITRITKMGSENDDPNNSGTGSGGFFPPIIIGGMGGGRSSGGFGGGGFGGFGGGGFGGGGAGRSF